VAAARTPALLLQIDDVVYDMLEHEEGWEVGDVIEAVERRLDFMVIHGTALYPHEAATRMLTPTFVRQRIQAAVRDIESRVIGMDVREDGESIVLLRQRTSSYAGNDLRSRITRVMLPDDGEFVVTMGIGL
jgi:hypothetical protein